MGKHQNPFEGFSLAVEFAHVLPQIALTKSTQDAIASHKVEKTEHGLRGAARAFMDLASNVDLIGSSGGLADIDLMGGTRISAELSPHIKKAGAALRSALEPSGSVVVDRVVLSALMLHRAAIEAATTVDNPSSDALRACGVALNEIANALSSYALLTVEAPGRARRQGKSGNLPNLALQHLIVWMNEHRIGPSAMARALVAAGITHDDETWLPTEIRADSRVHDAAIKGWEGQLKKRASELRAAARPKIPS